MSPILKVFMVLIAVAALGAVGAAIYVGTRTFEGTVVSDPFEEAAHYDEARHRAEALGWTLAIESEALRVGPQALRFSLASRDGAPLEGVDARVRLSRPGNAWQDQTAVARPYGPGRFAADVAIPAAGIWDVEIRASRGADRLAFQRRVQVGP